MRDGSKSNSPRSLQFALGFCPGFPDLFHTIDGDFFGIPATGKAIGVSAIAILTVVQGRVAELQAVFDQMSLMRQLGGGH